MHVLHVDVNSTTPQSGGMQFPDGYYLLQIQDATQVVNTKAGEPRQLYKSNVLMGPGWSEEYRGKPYKDYIMNTAGWEARHMELFVACFGSVEAVRQVAAAQGGRLAAEQLHGKMYIAQVVTNGGYNNVIARIPYSEKNWTDNVGANPSASLVAAPAMQPMAAPQPAPPPPMQQFQQPMAQPQFQQPQAQAQPQWQQPQPQWPGMPMAAPAPGMVTPPAPGMPGMPGMPPIPGNPAR